MRSWSTPIALLCFTIIFSGCLLPGLCQPSNAQDCCSEQPSNLLNAASFNPEPTLEQGMLALTNQHRIQKGLQPLVLDDALSRIAREQSHGMLQQGFISHIQPLGNLKARMTRASYPYDVARENVATAPSLVTAQNALIESPVHEGNILAGDVTRVGIGIARCPLPAGRQLYITEIFATPRKEYAKEAVAEILETRVDELRQNGAGSMIQDPALEKLASDSLLSISLPYKKEELQSLLTASADELRDERKRDLSRVQASVQLLHDPKNLILPGQIRDGQARSYGTAIRQVTDSQNQTAYLVLTLIGVSR
jgi:uncharacterized protein YkwD